MTYRRWRAGDIRSILATAGAAPTPRPAGDSLAEVLTLPSVPTRSLDAYKINTGNGDRRVERGRPVTASPPVLAADLNDGLKRLKMAAMRRLAPELLVTAKTQRWSPEEFLRTLVEAEIAARDASNAATRRRQAGFPVTKTLDDYDLTVSSVPQATFDYLASLEWIRAAENVCLIGPPGPGSLICGSAGSTPVIRCATYRRLPSRHGRQSHRQPAPQRSDHLRRTRIRPVRRHRCPTAVPVCCRRLRTPQPRHRLPLLSWVLPPPPPPLPFPPPTAKNPMTRSGDFSWPPAGPPVRPRTHAGRPLTCCARGSATACVPHDGRLSGAECIARGWAQR